MKKAAWGTGIIGSIVALALLLTSLKTIGKEIEPLVTTATAKRLDIHERKFEDIKRKQDEDRHTLIHRVDQLETKLLEKMKENNAEQVRLIVAAMRRNGGYRE